MGPEVAIALSDQAVTPDQKSVVLECKFSSKLHNKQTLVTFQQNLSV